MLGNYFYNESLRKTIIAFGSLFNYIIISRKIEQNMALPSNGVDPLDSIEDKSWVNGGNPEKIIGKHKDGFEQLQQKANGASKGNE